MTDKTMMAIKIASGAAVVVIGTYKIVKAKRESKKEAKKES